MVRPARRMFSAISFGVLRRSAPSTSAIMRSRNDLPGSCVTWITSRSESSFVPPVTAERSPPDSRITGADSPVMADSSTEPTPSTISPSAGMTIPASTTTMSPFARSAAATSSSLPPPSRRSAVVVVRVARSASACALPRPSAIASAKFAKSTVSQSQNAITPTKRKRAVMSARKIEEEDHRRDHAAELDDEHHRVLELLPRVELRERIADRRNREVAREDACALACHLLSGLLVECEVELEHVHTRLAEEPEAPAVGVLGDQLLHGRERQVADGCDPLRTGASRTPARCRGRSPSRTW